MRWKISLIVLMVLSCWVTVRAADTDQAVPDDVKKLIDQLGDTQYSKRQEATTELKAIGKPALPALKQAIAQNQDPEIVSRAQMLVKRIEIRPVPGIDPNAANGQVQSTRVQMSVSNGARKVEVNESGREIKIADGPDGIVMNVTGFVEGQPASEEYTAKDFAQLKEENPDAAALFERWVGGAGPGLMIRRQVQIGAGNVVQFTVPNVPDELEILRARLDKQMRDQKLKAADREIVNQDLHRLTEARNEGLAAGMEKYTDQCDEFRKTLAKYKLDAGELLPPPANARLGISVANEEGRLFVQNVSDKSRAEHMGLKPGDEIRKVDGKEVTDVGALRKVTTDNPKGMVMEITREGKEMTLDEGKTKGKEKK
jgi:hypothetical protein